LNVKFKLKTFQYKWQRCNLQLFRQHAFYRRIWIGYC